MDWRIGIHVEPALGHGLSDPRAVLNAHMAGVLGEVAAASSQNTPTILYDKVENALESRRSTKLLTSSATIQRRFFG